jgi:hypothetical protein
VRIDYAARLFLMGSAALAGGNSFSPIAPRSRETEPLPFYSVKEFRRGDHKPGPQRQIAAAGKSAEKLIVEIVPVSNHDDRRVLHRRMEDQAAQASPAHNVDGRNS